MIRAADFPGTKGEMGEEQMESQPFQSAAGLSTEKCWGESKTDLDLKKE